MSPRIRIRKHHEILISDDSQQQRHHGHGECRAKPSEPTGGEPAGADRFGRGRRVRTYGHWRGLFRQHNLAVLHEIRAGAHILRTDRTVKEVLFELIAHFGLEFVEQISFRHFLAGHNGVVHGCPLAKSECRASQRF
jgi:hypothetical protein